MDMTATPPVIVLDVRPEFIRPQYIRSALAVGMSAALFGAALWGWRVTGHALLLLSAAAPVACLVMAMRGLVCVRLWRRDIAKADEIIAQSAINEHQILPVCRGLLLRRYRSAFGESRLRDDFESAGLTPPRAIIVGKPNWTIHFPLSTTSDLLEPELIRSRASARRMIPISLMGLGQALAVLWLGILLIQNFLNVGTVLEVTGFVGLLTLVVLLIMSSLRSRGYSGLGGVGLIAGPSRIEQHGLNTKGVWTPDDSLMIVRRQSVGGLAIRVDLYSNREGAGGHESLRFFSPQDPGFQTLWQMWVHPMMVERLMED